MLADPRRIAELERQVAALARQVGNARGVGVSQFGGATQYRTTQLGFAAELTSAWDADTGYDWKRLDLVGVDFTDPGVQLTGDKAVTPDGETGLAAGTKGWLEPDPGAAGWVFVASSPSPTTGTDGSCRGPVAGWDEDTCLTLSVTDANGICTDDIEDQSIYAPWDAGAGGWVGEDPVPTAIGDGTITITVDADGDPRAEIEVGGGSAATVVGTYVGCDEGRLAFAFGGSGLCDGTPTTYCQDNTFRVYVECTPCEPPPYDPGVCDCSECPDGAAASFTFTLAGGDGDFAGANGSWTVTNPGGGCTWSGSLGGWTATLSVDPAGGTLTVTNGVASVSYKANFVCCGPWSPSLLSSTGTGTPPGDPTLAAVGNCGPCEIPATGGTVTAACCGGSAVTLPGTLYLNFINTGYPSWQTCPHHNQSMPIVWNATAEEYQGTTTFTGECGAVTVTVRASTSYNYAAGRDLNAAECFSFEVTVSGSTCPAFAACDTPARAYVFGVCPDIQCFYCDGFPSYARVASSSSTAGGTENISITP